MQASLHDYTTGSPRRHHKLYLEDGTLMMQVNIIPMEYSIQSGPLVLTKAFLGRECYLQRSSVGFSEIFNSHPRLAGFIQ